MNSCYNVGTNEASAMLDTSRGVVSINSELRSIDTDMAQDSTPLFPLTIEIPLTKGKVARIDASDLELVKPYSWMARSRNDLWYAISYTHDPVTKARHIVWMHRLILGERDGMVTDHKDGNGLNNTRSNLRFATHPQNIRNSKRRSDSKSPYKGAQYCPKLKGRSKWRAMICVDGRKKSLGLYESAETAAAAYNAAAKHYFGEFARLNDVPLDVDFASLLPREVPCEECGGLFLKKVGYQKCCSGSCSDRLWRKHRPEPSTNKPKSGQNLVKLSESAVLDIRRRRGVGENPKSLAQEYGVHLSLIYLIVNRKIWAWVQ